MTAQELYCLPGVNSKHAELVRGVLKVGEPSATAPSAVASKIALLLGIYVSQHDLGLITGEAGGYRLRRNPDTVRAPDVAFVRKERVPARIPRTFFDTGPDLAVEVLSPSDKRSKTLEKIDDYISAGVQLVWLVDLEQCTVTVYRPDRPPDILDDTETLSGEDVVPGFQLAIASILL